MRATRPGARMMSIGVQAGQTVSLSLRELVSRSHIGVGTGQRPAAERRAAFDRLMAMACEGNLKVNTRCYAFDDAAEACCHLCAGGCLLTMAVAECVSLGFFPEFANCLIPAAIGTTTAGCVQCGKGCRMMPPPPLPAPCTE